ncbi:MAG: ADP-L-glycero-D-manno-heptose-6-epimerase [Rhodanobacteraceae bacterium]|jgi:ADP-L-glycero-D-manno-heptose 6-epimerase|nr:MAG: ADP-L-glycero-D-manno-heptose-6-epimerase [Rhodanobacteraceae bacterium]
MILVTGGAGFIGSNIVAALSARGVLVAVCDFFGDEGKWRNLAKSELCDIVHPERLDAWLEQHADRLDAVVHMGAVSATDATDADLVLRTNFGLSWQLWQWCARHGKRFLYASSAATYGGGQLGYDDDGSPAALAKLRPLNLYGWSKHLFDRRVARAVADGEALPAQWAGLKFFNVYGPNEYHKGKMQSVVAHAYPVAAAGNEVGLFKSYRDGIADGEQKRDFIFVDDCVDVVLWLLDHPAVNGLFNVGTGQARSFADLIRALFAALDRPVRIRYKDMPDAIRDHYQYFTQARMTRLREAGFTQPFKPIEEGVRIYVQQYLSQADSYR